MRHRLRRTVALNAALADALRAESERHAPYETGGVLLGAAYRGLVQITELVDAGPGAKRAAHRFDPDGPWQRHRVAERYRDSAGTLAYLGDWHSHPLGGEPSALDRSTAARIANAPAARCPRPVFLIVTWDQDRWDLRAYQYRGRRFRPLVVVIERADTVEGTDKGSNPG